MPLNTSCWKQDAEKPYNGYESIKINCVVHRSILKVNQNLRIYNSICLCFHFPSFLHVAKKYINFPFLHCITLTSFPRGIQSPLVGACARNSRAFSLPGTSGMQSSGLVSSSWRRKKENQTEIIDKGFLAGRS